MSSEAMSDFEAADLDVTATLTSICDHEREGERVESTPRLVVGNRDEDEHVEGQDSAAFATPYHDREFLSPAGDLVQSHSPTETGSFHTADSLDSIQDDPDTEVDEDEKEDIDTMELIAGTGKKSPPPPARSTAAANQPRLPPPQPRLFDLPAGYEDQPKLAVRDEGVRPLPAKDPIPMDSSSYRTPLNSIQPRRNNPPKATPREATPLLSPQDRNMQSSEVTCCCTIV